MGHFKPLCVVIILCTIYLLREAHGQYVRKPMMAQKAGGRYRASVAPQETTTTTEAPLINSEENSGEDKENDSYYDAESSEESVEERQCSAGKIVFVKGGKCVPRRCYYGNSARNLVTGECHNEPKEGQVHPNINWFGRHGKHRGGIWYGGFR